MGGLKEMTGAGSMRTMITRCELPFSTTPATNQTGLLQVWLTSLTRGQFSRERWNHAQEVPTGVQA